MLDTNLDENFPASSGSIYNIIATVPVQEYVTDLPLVVRSNGSLELARLPGFEEPQDYRAGKDFETVNNSISFRPSILGPVCIADHVSNSKHSFKRIQRKGRQKLHASFSS